MHVRREERSKSIIVSWVSDYVKELDIPGEKYRGVCPACNRKGTFSVSDDGMQRLWFCFHADCNIKGRVANGFEQRLASANKPPLPVLGRVTDFEIPTHFVPPMRSEKCVDYLKDVHAYRAYNTGLVDVRYDVRQDRCVFLIKKDGKVVDAVGRTLRGEKPKWWRYGKHRYGFLIGTNTGSRCVVVEDVASASCVSDCVNSLALLGTHLLPEHVEQLRRFKEVVVCLDKDATRKAIDIAKKLCDQNIPARMVPLPRDLKSMTDEERNDFIRQHLIRSEDNRLHSEEGPLQEGL